VDAATQAWTKGGRGRKRGGERREASLNFFLNAALHSSFLKFTLGTCKASGFDSNWMIPIRFKSDGMIRNFRIGRSCRRITNYAHCLTKKTSTVIEIYFMFMILCLCSKSSGGSRTL